LRIGDNLVVGHIFGKVRALLDDRGRKMKEAGPATPAVVTGLPDVPTAGDVFQVVSSEKVARTIASQRAEQYRVATLAQTRRVTLADLSAQVGKGAVKDLNLVLKADSNGSVEALKGSLLKIQDPQVQIKVRYEPTFVQVWEGRAEVLTPIKIPKLGVIAGSRVQDGKITSGSTAKLLRDNKPIHEGQIAGLKRFKDDVKEVVAGLECGIR